MKMKVYSVSYFLKLAFWGIIRNSVMTIASVFALFCCLLVVGNFYLLTLNINHNLEGLKDYNKIVAFIKEDATEGDISDLQHKQFSHWESIRFPIYQNKRHFKNSWMNTEKILPSARMK